MVLSMVTGLHPWCPLPPHPNPPPRRGEGGGDVFKVFFAVFRLRFLDGNESGLRNEMTWDTGYPVAPENLKLQ